MAETLKLQKTDFRPWLMSVNYEKLIFGHGRNSIKLLTLMFNL